MMTSNPTGGLDGPSRRVIVEPLRRTEAPPEPERTPEREPEAPPERAPDREPDKVPA